MKKIITVIMALVIVMSMFTSCVTASAVERSYVSNDVFIENGRCYVYHTSPTTAFLNTLSVIDGTYYYLHGGQYLPVYFPNWKMWNPNRFYYYHDNRWMWRNRRVYTHPSYAPSRPNVNHRPFIPRKPSSTRETIRRRTSSHGQFSPHGHRR